ncbi:hypothetical protein CIP107503_01637 [Corynebacterium diphtheriae]|uniref:Uncharacterized protein n=2 Tax=Corynebacterium diphtheriae TaxID=1717 RepID=A0A811G702_CORDP|nr:hypothetical protein BKD85_02110 [Corynebacterium diphtheriae]OKY21172.1 hypothetical protein AOT42_06280 [Corynebacterium diphtheriae bv. gravis]OWM96611.1 hypothetical protein AY481_05535 [Corynebacterium diphtheriae bv. mitis]OFI65498.1 hypothetical protein BKD81_02105 [Corynebacterium diphtheriae]OKY21745.1 hypothetical protein AO271_02510 [Corynebacterium diphtheriae]
MEVCHIVAFVCSPSRNGLSSLGAVEIDDEFLPRIELVWERSNQEVPRVAFSGLSHAVAHRAAAGEHDVAQNRGLAP